MNFDPFKNVRRGQRCIVLYSLRPRLTFWSLNHCCSFTCVVEDGEMASADEDQFHQVLFQRHPNKIVFWDSASTLLAVIGSMDAAFA